jgi:hypothetical protein
MAIHHSSNLARVFVCFNHIARCIVNVNQGIV